MSRPAAPSFYRPEIGWKTLLAFEQALRQFTATDPPSLSFSAFAGVSALNVAALPPARAFTLSDGETLGFRRYRSDSSTQLVLIHGSGCFGDQLHEIAQRISAAGHAQVYTLNMRGHGLSSGERGHAVRSAGQIVADVAEFLQSLRAELPDDAIVLGGHSAGGGVVLGLSRTPVSDLVSGYIFFAPYLGLGSPSIRPYFGGWVKVQSLALRVLTLLNLIGIERFNDRTVIEFNMDACLHDPRFVKSWSFNTMLAFGPGRWLADATAIPADRPVLLLAGENDQCFVQPLYAEALRVIAPHAEMPVVGPSGHWDLLVHPRTIASIDAWLESKFPNVVRDVSTRGSENEAAA